jgi:hypothetical protein
MHARLLEVLLLAAPLLLELLLLAAPLLLELLLRGPQLLVQLQLVIDEVGSYDEYFLKVKSFKSPNKKFNKNNANKTVTVSKVKFNIHLAGLADARPGFEMSAR